MGLFKWLQKRGLAGMIPRNAYEQYQKVKRRDSTLSEAEIAQAIFMQRYVIGHPILNRKEVVRLSSYLESDFEFKSLVDFCFASLDIEGHIDPLDKEMFYDTASIIVEELKNLGFKFDVDVFLKDYLGGKDGDSEISSFVVKWNDHIDPHRFKNIGKW